MPIHLFDADFFEAEIHDHVRNVVGRLEGSRALSIRSMIDSAVIDLQIAQRGTGVRKLLHKMNMTRVVKDAIISVCPHTTIIMGRYHEERIRQTIHSLDLNGHYMFFLEYVAGTENRHVVGCFSDKADAAMFQMSLPDDDTSMAQKLYWDTFF